MLDLKKRSQSQAHPGLVPRSFFWSSKFNWLVVLLIITALGLWAWVQISGTKDANINYTYSLLLGVIPVVASLKGFMASRSWGGFSSVLGRLIGALSLGLLFWGAGELVWSWYNFFPKVAAPYPSLADPVYVLGYFFWIASTVFLTRLAGIRIVLRKKPQLLILATVVTALGTALSYYLLIVVARQGQILSDSSSAAKTFLDIFYPFADFATFAIVAIVVTVSIKYIGGKLRLPVLLMMLGMAAMYVGDIVFVYTVTKGSFYNSDRGDLILLIGMSLFSLAVLKYAESVPVINEKNPR